MLLLLSHLFGLIQIDQEYDWYTYEMMNLYNMQQRLAESRVDQYQRKLVDVDIDRGLLLTINAFTMRSKRIIIKKERAEKAKQAEERLELRW